MSTPSSASAAETRGQPAPAAGSAPSADACGAPAVAGSLFVVVAPSGAGKTSLVRALMAQRPDIEL